ncbi:MAG: class D sortase [Acidobacteriota bacterium]|nr:class D sortase [Acidobacteriota bacterium]
MTVRLLLRDSGRSDWNQGIIRWAEYLFLFIGLIALDCYIWVSLDSTFYQAYESWSFDRQVKGLPVSIPKFVAAEFGLNVADSDTSGAADRRADTDAASATDTLPGDTTRTEPQSRPSRSGTSPNPAAPLGVIGRILVPRLQLSAMVREGVEDDTLRRAVGHIPSTALPGQVGNVGLAGHRDTFFRKLRDIRKTDKIVVSTLKGNYDYEVESMKIVAPRDVSVLQAMPGEQVLTLVTCYPFNYVGAAPKRFIVRAKQLDVSSPPQQSGS